MITFEPTYLYIKQHKDTGLKYFGKTTKKDPTKYLGSGKYWKKHIKKHGRNVETLWYQLFTDEKELIEYAEKFSKNNMIVESDEWANLKDENGLDGGSDGSNMLGKKHSEKTISKMKKPKSDKANYFGHTPWNKNKNGIYKHNEEVKKKISESKMGNPSRTGMPHNDETKNKLRLQKIGLKRYKNNITGQIKMFKPENVDTSLWIPTKA